MLRDRNTYACSPRRLLGLLVVMLVFFSSPEAVAQLNRGVIEGTVSDPRGAVVPDVTVLIVSADTNVTQTTKTNTSGYYRAVDLVPGKYHARVKGAGFAPLDIAAIEVSGGQVVRVDAQLRIESKDELITVTALTPILETEASNFSTVLSSNIIQNLPLAGRDLQQLAFLVPGVNNVGGPPGSNFGFNSQFGTFPDPIHLIGSALSVNGGQSGANAWYLDGNINVSGLGENIVVNPTPDVVSEFQAITNAFSAEYGSTGGAVFNVVLKSGSNAVHGNVYEYVRNDATNARNPFSQVGAPQTAIRFNNFGGTLGGPVKIPQLYDGKNKTFFFFSMDESILHQKGQNVFTVPTPLMRMGNFSEDPNIATSGIYDPYTTAGPQVDGTFSRSAFMTGGNLATAIPSNRLDPAAMFFINSFPSPNHIDTVGGCSLGAGAFSICNNFLGPVGSSQDTTNLSIKVDHQTSEKSHIFAEWLYSPTQYANYLFPWAGPTFPQHFIGFGGTYNFDDRNQIIALGHTYIVNPTLINEFRGSFSRQFIDTHPTHPYPDSVTAQSAVQKALAPSRLPSNPLFPSPNFNIAGPEGSTLNFGPDPWTNLQTGAEAYTILDNVTKIISRHTLKTGFMYRIDHGIYNSTSPTILNFSGALASNPTSALGDLGLAQFMLGAVAADSTGFTGRVKSPYTRWRRWGFYVQDDFRLRPSFTLSVGLRYDINGYWKARYSPLGNFCFTCSNPLTGLKGEAIYSGDPEFPKGDILPANHGSIAPRLNFAWSPGSDQKTVIRGGYDIFYSDSLQNINAPGQSAFNGSGWSRNGSWSRTFPTLSGQCQAFGGPCVAFPLSDTSTDKASLVFPSITGTFPAQTHENTLGSIYAFIKPRVDPMVQSWTLEVQRELRGKLSFSVAYVGSHGTHLSGSGPGNYFNFVSTKDKLDPINGRAHLSDVVPITDYYSGQTATQLGILNADPLTGTPATMLPRNTLLLPYPFFAGGIFSNGTYDGTSVYHGLNVKVEKRYAHGLDFIAAYTFSKKIVNWSAGGAGVEVVDPTHFTRGGLTGGRGGALSSAFGGPTSFQDPDNKNADRSISSDDVPHSLNIGATYELPVGRGKVWLNRGGIVNGILGGWKLSGNFNAQSGLPLSILCPASSLQASIGSGVGRCNLIGDPHFHGKRSKAQRTAHWINANAFEPAYGSDTNFWANYDPTDPRAWTFGNASIRSPGGIRSPGFWNLDSTLSKQFHITETKYAEFHWDVFNTLNHQNLGLPNTNFCLPPGPSGETDLVRQAGCTFGQITNVQTDPRAMQFALKFYW